MLCMMVHASCVYTEPAGVEEQSVYVEMLTAALIVRWLLVSMLRTNCLSRGCG
jgi:hypothetical protein